MSIPSIPNQLRMRFDLGENNENERDYNKRVYKSECKKKLTVKKRGEERVFFFLEVEVEKRKKEKLKTRFLSLFKKVAFFFSPENK